MNNQPGQGPQAPNQNPNRRNFFVYAAIALLIMMLLNAFVMPRVHGANITEVDYGTFLKMIDGEVEGVTVDAVQIDENGQEIIFSAKDETGKETYYSTGVFPDAELVDRLKANENIRFTKLAPQENSFLMEFLLTWVLPTLILMLPMIWMMRYMQKKGGGGMFGSEPNRLAGIGSNGGLVYVPNVFIGKGVSLNVRVGKGGNGSWDGEGVSGTESYVKNVSDDITYAFAGGGAGGPGWHLWFTKSGDGNDENYVSGCTSSGEHVIWGLLQGIGARKVRINKSDRSEGPGYPRVFTQVYACDGGTASSDIASAVVIKGKKVSGSLGSSSHQNRWYPYNLVSSLTNYNGIFDMNYNILSKRSTKWCNSSSTWKTARNCQIYSNNFGAGGAAEGDYDEEYFEPISGGSGLAAIKYKPLFAGLGGEAGKVVQIPYAEMPQKTLLFPGKGGNGGKGSNITYHNTANTPGGNGQSSYIKNGTQIYGGKGASGINPADDSTYSSKFNDDQMPVGGDGLLADVLTNKKVGTGGLGGFSGNNNTMNGLTETIFEDGALVSGFNKIFGAGSGGGGASAAADSTGSVQLGDGGNGASGLVFIQW